MIKIFAPWLMVIASCLTTSGAFAQQAKALTSAEIASVFIGKTVKQVDDQYWAFFEPGGALKGLYVNEEDGGRWGFAGNQLCQKWTRWAGGQPMCFFILEGVGGAYRFDNGQGGGFNVTINPGNPKAL